MFKTISIVATSLLSLSAFAQGISVINSNALDLEGLGRKVNFKMTKNIIIPAGQREAVFCQKESPLFLNGKIHNCAVSGKVITGNPSTDARALPRNLKGSRSFVNAMNNIILNEYRSQKIYQYKLSDDFDMSYEVKCKPPQGTEAALFGAGFDIELTPGHLKGICSDAIESIGARIALVEMNNSDSVVGENLNRCAEVSDAARSDGYGYATQANTIQDVGLTINGGDYSNIR